MKIFPTFQKNNGRTGEWKLEKKLLECGGNQRATPLLRTKGQPCSAAISYIPYPLDPMSFQTWSFPPRGLHSHLGWKRPGRRQVAGQNEAPRGKPARYLKLLFPKQLALVQLFIGLPLVPYVFHNCFLASILTHGVRIVSTRPQRTAPQYLFYFRMPPEDFLRCDTLDNRNQSSHGHSRNTLYQKMNMIFLHTDFNKDNFIPFSNSKANVTKAFLHAFGKNLSSIFGRKYQMIQK